QCHHPHQQNKHAENPALFLIGHIPHSVRTGKTKLSTRNITPELSFYSNNAINSKSDIGIEDICIKQEHRIIF
ncbi:MAG TPA: hypothetical protein PKX86_06355, partial [Bacteroidia bacterium]|nr:hypothetical protein [Bacteroidia bacterium]